MNFIQLLTGKGGPLGPNGVLKLNESIEVSNQFALAVGDDFIAPTIAPAGGTGFSLNHAQIPPLVPKRQILQMIKNSSGSSVAMGGILVVSDNQIFQSPTGGAASLAAFQTVPILIGVAVPGAGSGAAGTFAIATAPIANGAIGPCVVNGVAACQVDIQTALDPFADLKASDNTQLESGNVGAAQILSAPTGGTGTQWCIVRIGNLWPPGALFEVALTSDGTGSLGNDASKSSWKYNLKDLNGNQLNSGGGVAPDVGRINGTFAAASYGIAYYDFTDNLHLLCAFELPGTTHC